MSEGGNKPEGTSNTAGVNQDSSNKRKSSNGPTQSQKSVKSVSLNDSQRRKSGGSLKSTGSLRLSAEKKEIDERDKRVSDHLVEPLSEFVIAEAEDVSIVHKPAPSSKSLEKVNSAILDQLMLAKLRCSTVDSRWDNLGNQPPNSPLLEEKAAPRAASSFFDPVATSSPLSQGPEPSKEYSWSEVIAESLYDTSYPRAIFVHKIHRYNSDFSVTKETAIRMTMENRHMTDEEITTVPMREVRREPSRKKGHENIHAMLRMAEKVNEFPLPEDKGVSSDKDEPVNGISAEELTTKLVRENHIVIFKMQRDNDSAKVQRFLWNKGIEFVSVDLDSMDEFGFEVRQYLVRLTNVINVPYVFIGGKFVGGYGSIHEANQLGLLHIFFTSGCAHFDYDLVVVGAGLGGIGAAIGATAQGKTAAIINFPPKHEFDAQYVFWNAVKSQNISDMIGERAFHLSSLVGDAPDYGWLNLSAENEWQNLQEDIRLSCESRDCQINSELQTLGVRLYNGFPNFTDQQSVKIETEGKTIHVTAKCFVLDLPCYSGRSSFKGRDFCLAPEDLIVMHRRPGKTLIYGGGREALQCAGALARYGADVTLMMPSKLLREFDKDIVARIRKSMIARGIKFVEKCTLSEVKAAPKKSQNRYIAIYFMVSEPLEETFKKPEVSEESLIETSDRSEDNLADGGEKQRTEQEGGNQEEIRIIQPPVVKSKRKEDEDGGEVEDNDEVRIIQSPVKKTRKGYGDADEEGSLAFDTHSQASSSALSVSSGHHLECTSEPSDQDTRYVTREGSCEDLLTFFDEPFDTVVLAIDSGPKPAQLNLCDIGVKVDKITQKILVDEESRTSLRHILAVGESVQGGPVTSTDTSAGHILVKKLYDPNANTFDQTKYSPRTIYIPSECSGIGETEKTARAIYGDDIIVYHSLFEPVKKALSARSAADEGYIKIVCALEGQRERILGIHVFGNGALEVTTAFSLTIQSALYKEDLDTLIGIHPTIAEVFTSLNTVKEDEQELKLSNC